MKLSGIKISLCVLAATSLLLVTACERKDTNMPKVFRAVAKFNTQFNAGNFQEAYTNADSRLRGSISEDVFVAKLNELRQQCGRILESGMDGFNDLTWWQRRFPELKLTRFIGIGNKCANGRLQEFFEWDVSGDEAKLIKFDTDPTSFNSIVPK